MTAGGSRAQDGRCRPIKGQAWNWQCPICPPPPGRAVTEPALIQGEGTQTPSNSQEKEHLRVWTRFDSTTVRRRISSYQIEEARQMGERGDSEMS